jgi:hypothetical protein
MIYIYLLFAIILIPSFKQRDINYKELAYRYAPIHYQDTDNTNAKADYITKFDYDGNWAGTDNWEHLETGNLSAYVYYSIVETDSHWFIVYAFFHPRDWTDRPNEQEHENDMEGVLCIVRRSTTGFGTLEGMISVAHEHFYSSVPRGSRLTSGIEDIDDTVYFQNFEGISHPKTSQEAKGHGIRVWPCAGDFSGKANEDGIIYYPSKTTAEVPSSGNDRMVKYKLIDLNAGGNFWTMQMVEATRAYEQTTAYAKWGTLKGDAGGTCGDRPHTTCPKDKANTPWGWDDVNDGDNFAGELALDPAAIADYYFNGDNFNWKYTRNKYLEELKRQGFNENFVPSGWPSKLKLPQLYEKLNQ